MVAEVWRPSVGQALNHYIWEAMNAGVKQVILATDPEGVHILYSLLDDSKFVPGQSEGLAWRMKKHGEWLMDAVPEGLQAVVTINPPSLETMRRSWQDTEVQVCTLYFKDF